MSWDLSLHTVVSFLTNTNQQHYSGQAQLSYFAQMFGITALQVITPIAGLAALVAIARTLLARPDAVRRTADDRIAVGNFYSELVRGVVRITLPLAFITALLLAWQGVSSTFAGAQTVDTLDPIVELEHQRVPVGQACRASDPPEQRAAAARALGAHARGGHALLAHHRRAAASEAR